MVQYVLNLSKKSSKWVWHTRSPGLVPPYLFNNITMDQSVKTIFISYAKNICQHRVNPGIAVNPYNVLADMGAMVFEVNEKWIRWS